MPEFARTFQLSTIDGRNGYQLSGEAARDGCGSSVAAAGDLNGDGFEDLIVGATLHDANGIVDSGAAYVVFGNGSITPVNLDLSSLTGGNGFKLNGDKAGDYTGYSVASAGDVNGDGFADLVIGARNADPNGTTSGATYLVFGKASGFPIETNLSSLSGVNGFRIDGGATNDFSSLSIDSAGDINGDGFDDIIVGAFGADSDANSSGSSYIIFGKNLGFSSHLQLSGLNGTNGFQISGELANDLSGIAVAGAGDVNGDGYADVIIGAPGLDLNGSASGGAYVVFGNASGLPANFKLMAINGTNGFQLNGERAGDGCGWAVAGAGDINGDGFADVIVGAKYADPHGTSSGASYVVFGKASGFNPEIELSGLDGKTGFRLNGKLANDQSGGSVASAGDVNGDGFDDLIVGARGNDSNGPGAGASYVLFGKASGFSAVFDFSSLNGNNGFQILGPPGVVNSGTSVSSAGDLNGDGFTDLIVGANRASPHGFYSGAAYVIYGHRAFETVNRVGTTLDNTINGGVGDDTISGLSGNDVLIGWEGNDTVTGGAGRDMLIGRKGIDVLVGGSGRDVLLGGQDADVFDFNTITDSGASGLSRDVIRDFTHLEDKIDLSDLGALSFIGLAGFSGANQVKLLQAGIDTIVQINLTDAHTPEMTIVLNGVSALSLNAGDFFL